MRAASICRVYEVRLTLSLKAECPLSETCLLETVLQMADLNQKAVRLGIVPPSSDYAWASAE